MPMLTLIGDVHGKTDEYAQIVSSIDTPSVCVGDFGFRREHDWHLQNIDGDRHRILFGNHDYYPYVTYPHSLGDYRFDESGILFIRGAHSIDFSSRRVGLDFFYEEELSYLDFVEIGRLVNHYKPHTIVSHDCPQMLADRLWHYDPSLTRRGLDFVWNNHKPQQWIFGHHHVSLCETIDGCTFRCLDELETYKCDLLQKT